MFLTYREKYSVYVYISVLRIYKYIHIYNVEIYIISCNLYKKQQIGLSVMSLMEIHSHQPEFPQYCAEITTCILQPIPCSLWYLQSKADLSNSLKKCR